MRLISFFSVPMCICLSVVIGCGDTEPAAMNVVEQVDADSTLPEVLPVDCMNPGTEAATAACLTPTQSPEYYVAEALAYFDTLDVDADRGSGPNYHEQVARWEWPPWLLLTGYGAADMVVLALRIYCSCRSTIAAV